MSFTQQYFVDAQKVIMDVLLKERPELMKHHGKVEFELKVDASVVTHLDKDLELKLKSALARFDASVGFWGEEHGREGNDKDYWLIDPIDGTEQFIRGMPSARNILSFVSNDQPQFALCYVFPTKDLYIAERGKGTTKNGRKIMMSDRSLKRSWLEFSVNMQDDIGYSIYKYLRPHVAGLPSTYDFASIMDGYLDGLVVYNSKGDIWDYVPRVLMILEAGGRAANFGSTKYDIHNQNLIATNPIIFDEVHNLLSPLT